MVFQRKGVKETKKYFTPIVATKFLYIFALKY